MGYLVSTAFAVSSNDGHRFFVYFVPARRPYQRLSTTWINTWVHSNFSRLASSIGPNGVVILPHPNNDWEEEDYRQIGYCLFRTRDDSFLHGHMPFLIISRAPLQKSRESSQALAINLVKCENERQLEGIFDNIIDGIRRNDWQSIIDTFPLQEHAEEPDGYGGWFETLNKVMMLRPNIFGIGADLNKAIDLAGDRLADRQVGKITAFVRKDG